MASKEQQKNRGFYDMQQPLSKTQPAKPSDPSMGDHSGMKNTDERYLGGDTSHDFNYKAKVTSGGGNFHDFGDKNAGLKFNGSQKDASLDYLKDRSMKGQEVRNFSGGNEVSRLHTMNGGVTAYNSMPVNEVYRSATSNKEPPQQAIKDSTITRPESEAPGDQTKIGQQVRHSKAPKSKVSKGY